MESDLSPKNTAPEKDTIWSFFIKRSAVSWFMILGFSVLGVFSFLSMPRELQPEINIPYGFVTTVLPGANPSDTETLITEPIEQELSTVSDIKIMSSTSGSGFSSIFIEFEASANLADSIQAMKDAVDRVKGTLPNDATDPIVAKAETNEFPIITFSVIGERPLFELTDFAEKLHNSFEKITGVAGVDIVGGQTKYILVNIDAEKLNSYGLSLQNVSDLIRSADFNLPVGIISTDKLNYSIRIDNKFKSLADIQNMPLFNLPGKNPTTIFLKDIADIEEKYSDIAVISRLSTKGENVLQNVSVRINKKDSGNILTIVENAKTTVTELQANKTIPEDVQIVVSNDNSQFIKDDLGVLTESGYQTVLLVIIILFLGLGLKEGLLAGLSVPLTFLIAFPIMDALGLTLNGLTLFALVISLGIMVDVSIVIMQGIHSNLRQGMSALQAALLSVETYKWAMISGTLTTIFAFFPMLLVQGLIGEFLKSLPITLTITLLSSLIVSTTLIPSISTKFLGKKTAEKHGSLLTPVFGKIGNFLYNFLHKTLQKRSRRVFLIIGTIMAFIISLALPITGILKTELFPRTNMNYFIIDVETPKGIIMEETAKVVDEIEEKLYKIPEIDNFLSVIGSSQSQAFTDLVSTGGTTDSNVANITVNLANKEERKKTSYELADEIRAEFKNFTKGKISVRELQEGPPGEAALTVRVTGENLETLTKISDDIKLMLEKVPETQNITSTLTPGLNEFVFTLDPDRLAFYGLNTAQVSLTVRNAVQGIKSTTVTFDNKDYDIFVKYDLPEKNGKNNFSTNEIDDIEIKTPGGNMIPLSMIGNYKLLASQQSIAHEDEKRIVKVVSDISQNTTAVEATARLQELLDQYATPAGYEIEIGGDLAEIQESFLDLYRSMFIGIILIGLSLIFMFNSFKQAFINLFTLPLGLIGVFPGLYIMGLNLSFPAFLGIVALAGVVVNNSIVLIERINVNRQNGIEFKEAIAEASKSRFEPILMTSITTVVGIVPLAMTNEFWAGLGYALAFGLIFSTFFTLNVIPTLYYAFEARKEKKRLAARHIA